MSVVVPPASPPISPGELQTYKHLQGLHDPPTSPFTDHDQVIDNEQDSPRSTKVLKRKMIGGNGYKVSEESQQAVVDGLDNIKLSGRSVGSPEGHKNSNEEVQVPATDPSHRAPVSFQRSFSAELAFPSEPDVQTRDSTPKPLEKQFEDDGKELEPYDWHDLEARYSQQLQAINDEQSAILEDFDRFAETFTAWSNAAALRDTDRAAKRLKTRERFVQLQEMQLAEKKLQYDEIVDAFRKALDLLKAMK